ncbi:hypothetical protein ACFO4P_16955 [Epilithonimonas pallida]|uniref:Uncharacterized protein n=1 Tax=Epilithonimonas pallida TaxID=373671 RepID=A0ABY1R790_9FLAO|nr:hypothetical protein [Epilithonimonas pallida]SMP94673.1 hypothetical protein SAMN05421679_10676 [Epilithonimonas pallida]
MKHIIVVVSYSAYVPEDMTVDQLEESIDETVRNNFEGFRATAENYHDEEESEPWFELSGVMAGTESMISVGGN